jgi:hypothetical protein
MALIQNYLREAEKKIESKNYGLDMLYNEIEAMGDSEEVIDSPAYQDLKKHIDSYENEIKFLKGLINLCHKHK